MYIERHIGSTVKKLAGMFPSVLVTGPRQVGKSTLVTKIFPEAEYILLDNPVLLSAFKTNPLGVLQSFTGQTILDEIQRVPESFLTLKYMIDADRKPGMYILTGSQKFELMQNVTDSLAGRIGIINMLGLSNREINGDSFNLPFMPSREYAIQRENAPKISDTELWRRIHRGFMPEMYENEDKDWELFYSAYLSTYVERDVRQLAQVGDLLAFTQFMTALAARTGQLLNMNALSKDVGISGKTAKHWLSILNTSGLVYLLQPFSSNISKRAVRTPKVYFTDTGLVCFLCRWLTPDTLRNGAMAGSIFETYVVSEILKSYLNSGVEPGLYYFRNTDGQEVDLLFYRNNTVYPVEIKRTASPSAADFRSFGSLKTFFPNAEIGEGGVVCCTDRFLPFGKDRYSIPVSFL